MMYLFILTGIAVLVSFIASPAKTVNGIFRGLQMFVRLLPLLILMLAAVSIILFFIPNDTLVKYLGEDSGFSGWVLAAVFGSVSLIPGFIAFPLGSVLVKSGVALSTMAVFITTLMMVGIVTLPLEARYFGFKTSVLRNFLSLVAALIVGLLMGLLL